MKKRYFLTAFLMLAGLNSSASAKQLFDNFYFFGDSLSDMGNNPGNGSDQGAPVTSPGGSTWTKYLAEKFGGSSTPSNNGGNDYGYAGSQTSALQGQINSYFATHTINRNALYSVWSGSNDIDDDVTTHLPVEVTKFTYDYFLEHHSIPTDLQVENYIVSSIIPSLNSQSIANISDVINQLHSQGAKFIVVFNLPNLGLTPKAKALGNALDTIATLFANNFNQQLLSGLNNLGYSIIQVDIYGLLNDVIADPAHFGFTNVTDPCHNTITGTTCSNPNKYLFWDQQHPTAVGHQMIADYVYSIIQGPPTISILADAPFSVMDGQNANLEGQLYSLRISPINFGIGQYIAFANSSYVPYDQDDQGTEGAGFDAHNTNLNAGLVYRVNDNFLAGFGAGYSFGNINFGENMGGADMSEDMFSLFGSYQYQKLYIDSMLDYGRINYDRITRNIQIGPSQNIARGNTQGSQTGIDIIFGYNILNNAFKAGPLADIDYQHVSINNYSETGSIGAIAQNFGSQSNNQLTTGLGVQAAYTTQFYSTYLTPFTQFTYNHNWDNGERNVQGGLVSLPGSHFTIPVSSPLSKNFALANVGVTATLTQNINLSLGYQATIFAFGGDSQNIDASLQVSF